MTSRDQAVWLGISPSATPLELGGSEGSNVLYANQDGVAAEILKLIDETSA